MASGQVTAEVIAPVPWLPSWAPTPAAGRLDQVPLSRKEGDLLIHHPRYLVVPKIGMTLTPHTLFWTLKHSVAKVAGGGAPF